MSFVKVPAEFLKTIATDSDRIPTLYYSKYWPVRHFFWARLTSINKLITACSTSLSNCMDFGGGGGVFLPTLSHRFKSVTLLDLETAEASKVIENHSLPNIHLIREDVATVSLPANSFDAIIAADVLEHFKDLSMPLSRIKLWLKNDGYFFTSLPTENWIYVLLRKIFGVTKPWDHYHDSAEVEKVIKEAGFRSVNKIHFHFFIPMYLIYSIQAWRKER